MSDSDGAAAPAARRASPSDLGAVVELRIQFERITRDSRDADWGARRGELGSLLGPDLGSGALAVWLAEDRGRAVAQAALRVLPPRRRAAGGGRAAAPEGELLNVYTEPAYRGRGVATALVALALAEARRLGLARVRLQPTDDSRRIYEKAGFRARGRGMAVELAGP